MDFFPQILEASLEIRGFFYLPGANSATVLLSPNNLLPILICADTSLLHVLHLRDHHNSAACSTHSLPIASHTILPLTTSTCPFNLDIHITFRPYSPRIKRATLPDLSEHQTTMTLLHSSQLSSLFHYKSCTHLNKLLVYTTIPHFTPQSLHQNTVICLVTSKKAKYDIFSLFLNSHTSLNTNH